MRRLASAVVTALFALAAGSACATSGDTLSGEPGQRVDLEQPVVGDDAWAERTMIDLERRMQQAQRVEIDFEIESEGVVPSQLSGTLRWVRDGEISLDVKGMFAGQPHELAWRGDAETFATIVEGEQRWSAARPPALIEAVVLGLTRQGLLHNIAVLVGGLPPDHCDGGFGEWLTIDEPQLGPPERFGETTASPLEFGIVVEDQHVGRATLWLQDGAPLERRQTVQFPEGQMKVVERYTKMVIVD